MTEIRWHNRARKQIKKMPKQYQEAIFDHVNRLAFFPESEGLDIMGLKNHRYDFRLWVGRFGFFSIMMVKSELSKFKK